MIDISKFEILKDTDDSSVIRYAGENQYVIYQDSGYYTLSVRRLDGLPDGLEETYGCSSLSIAIASIEDLEQGKEI